MAIIEEAGGDVFEDQNLVFDPIVTFKKKEAERKEKEIQEPDDAEDQKLTAVKPKDDPDKPTEPDEKEDLNTETEHSVEIKEVTEEEVRRVTVYLQIGMVWMEIIFEKTYEVTYEIKYDVFTEYSVDSNGVRTLVDEDRVESDRKFVSETLINSEVIEINETTEAVAIDATQNHDTDDEGKQDPDY